MIKIQINGTMYEVKPGNNLLQTCLALGFDIPYFCYHPALGSVGACRMCAVKKYANTEDKKGRIVMSCMEPVVEGLIISTDDAEVKAFRASVIEGLMTNHPHDCPVCDEGGECHLQDMTVMSGHNYRRFIFKKRTHNNQYLGPNISHEMNRCIQCYRCVRYYKDYAGGKDLDVMGSANHVYFGRQNDGDLESEFSGNLVEVCPTGVFTDKTLKEHFTRKWDLTNSPSVCTQCSLGCNTFVSERYGSVRRILNRYNGDVNGYFLCDRGRFGYKFVNDPGRIKRIMARPSANGNQDIVSEETYQNKIRSAFKGNKIAGIGSPTASLESNFALELLVGKDNFYMGIPGKEFELVKTAVRILKSGASHSPSLKEIEKSDAILILGEDVAKSAPMMALSVRQATRNMSFKLASKAGIPFWNDAAVRELAQDARSPVFIAALTGAKNDDLPGELLTGSIEEIVSFGNDIANAIKKGLKVEKNPDNFSKTTPQKIAGILLNADNPVIITGLQCMDKSLLEAAESISVALGNSGKKVSLSIVFPEFNTLGTGLMAGKSLDDLNELADKGNVETLVILENDLYSRTTKEKVDALFGRCSNLIVLDSLVHDTTRQAGILLPSGTFAESTGTVVNNEGRAQRYYRVLPQDGQVKDSWRHLAEISEITGRNTEHHFDNFDGLVTLLTESYPFLVKIKEIMPDSGYRYFNEKIARQTLRFSGRTSIDAGTSVVEPGPPADDDSPLAFSMEGFKGLTPPNLTPYYWTPGWNSVQALNKYMDEPGGDLKGGNPGVLLFGDKDVSD